MTPSEKNADPKAGQTTLLTAAPEARHSNTAYQIFA
jgi:hypothetical protein